MRTKIFLDTEFTGLHQGTTLISLGLVSECGKTFYAEFTDYDKSQIDDWLKNNVISRLSIPDNEGQQLVNTFKGDTKCIEWKIRGWLDTFPICSEFEIWSDCLAYDWVLFSNIFGSAFDIPSNVYYIPFDICTMFKLKGINPDISREEFIGNSVHGVKHNALYDAKVIKACFDKLNSGER